MKSKIPKGPIMPGAVLVAAKAHLEKHNRLATVAEIAQELKLPVERVLHLAERLVWLRLATLDSEGHVRPVLLSDSQPVAAWKIEGGTATP